MFSQYWIIVDLLELLVCACFDQNRHFRLQYLLYQIKLALLRSDDCSEEEMAILCPVADLERVRTLFMEALTYQGALAVQDQLEEELSDIIKRLEATGATGDTAEQALAAGRIRAQFSQAGKTAD